MAKEKSLFKKYVDRLAPVLSSLIEKVNDKRKDERTYLHKDSSILRKQYAPDNKWEANSVNVTYVAADFMAFDSPVKIKTRPTIATANGKLPKSGLGRNLTESQLTELQVMEAQGGNDERIAKKVADDMVFCNVGLDELNEWAFLYGLCYGFVGVPDVDHPQQLMRMNFNYLDENTYGTETLGVITLDDIDRVFSAANDNNDSIDTVWISKSALKALRQTRKARELVADADDKVYTDSTSLRVPSESRFKEVFESEYNCTMRIIDRTIIFEQNGNKLKKKPWADSRVIFTCNGVVGSFVYGELAENRNRVPGVTYSLIDDYKLISRYSVNDPSLVEKTKGEQIAAAVIEDVDQIYVLDSTHSVAVDEEAEEEDSSDIYITYMGKKYLKTTFVSALNAVSGGRVKATASDEAIIKKVNELSDEQEDVFQASISNSYVPTIKLNKTTATIAKDATVTLVATTIPATATVTWDSSDDTKASVNNGVVTGEAAGSANITASFTQGGQTYTATCAVTVTA